MTEKPRTTIIFDQDVFDRVLAQRGKAEYARKTISGIVNDLLRKELLRQQGEDTALMKMLGVQEEKDMQKAALELVKQAFTEMATRMQGV